MSTEKKSSKLRRVARHPIKIVKHVYHFPGSYIRLQQETKQLREEFLALNHRNAALREESEKWYKLLAEQQDTAEQRLRQFDDRLTDTAHQVTILGEKPRTSPSSKGKETTVSSEDRLVADEHLLDNFYVHFEKWFRGSEAEIKERQAVYLPYFQKSKVDAKKYPVVDIGCGNGEFVELLHEHKIRGIGLDLNKAMIDHVKSKGLEAAQGDALSYLRKQKNNSLKAITGFHIVEHIPFLDLVRIFNECYRVLAPGGFVIFETPNPENVIVGSCNFYSDPSHLHPLPPAFLGLVMKTRGFQKTEIKRLHPIKEKIESKDPLLQEIAERMYGPQDYAVIAHK